jgi:hypothetical protein
LNALSRLNLSLFTIHFSLFTIHYSLFTFHFFPRDFFVRRDRRGYSRFDDAHDYRSDCRRRLGETPFGGEMARRRKNRLGVNSDNSDGGGDRGDFLFRDYID